ncbi:hypothetical protein [Bacillus cereus]|uniref:hypothetical protein n=1 Tax=Bacillus cereus TaxID=1396 RepID=UPI000BF6C966|nr:hypothetical protein [Bacillus cereus]PFL43552.1 hypothetical protein COJ06_02395 [Bacillus cereus]PGQ66436.1 hypothetical protein COA27_26635 [Bacillus cereus]
MKKNKLLSVLFSVALLFGALFTALSFPTGASAKIMDSGEATIDHTSTGDKSGKSSDEVEFSVTPGYGHVKVHLQNLGASNVQVYLKHKDSGHIYIDNLNITPGQSAYEWKSNERYPQGVRAGNYELSFRSGSQPLKVYYAYKSSDLPW